MALGKFPLMRSVIKCSCKVPYIMISSVCGELITRPQYFSNDRPVAAAV